MNLRPVRAELHGRAAPAPRAPAAEHREIRVPAPIRLAIVDPNRMFREVIAVRLGAEDDIQVLRCTDAPATLCDLVAQTALDVVLADAGLFDASTTPERLRGSRAAVVLLGDHRDEASLVPAVGAGVRGWVPRTAPVDQLLAAIRAAAAGGTWLSPASLTRVLSDLVWSSAPKDPTQNLLGTLTPREREVLSCLAEGLTRREVAMRLRMSTNTVRTHVQSILSKLGVSSSLAAVALQRSAEHPSSGPRAR